MKLHSLKIDGFRRIQDSTIFFDEATFLIGVNNVGKSSVLNALEYLLSDTKRLLENDYFSITEDGENKRVVGKVVLEAEFRNVPDEANGWRGFRGRILKYTDKKDERDTGNKFVFKKTFEIGKDVEVQMLQCERVLKKDFENCKTISDYKTNGIDLIEHLPELASMEVDKNLSAAQIKKIIDIEDLYEYNDHKQEWFTNPGGIPGNVLSKLPKYIFIPAQHAVDELDGKSGAFVETLNELFKEIRDESENFKQAQRYLALLSQELDASDETSAIGQMISDIDNIISDIFPHTNIHAFTNLTDADKVIKPDFNIEISSNVKTPVKFQGTGIIRSAVFALLRYKNTRDLKKIQSGEYVRPLIIGFEEPELYLHPTAAYKMRDTIYSLAEKEQNQIVCTTHSTYMIDLSVQPSQILNNLTIKEDTKTLDSKDYEAHYVSSQAFNVTKALLALQEDEKSYVKMLLRFDDEVTKVFFANNVLIVEGDTEYMLILESLKRMNATISNHIKNNWHVVRARGKAAIIPLVKYFKALNICVEVICDKDANTPNAEKFNPSIIAALEDEEKCHLVSNCTEDLLGYAAPQNDKPYKAYKFVENNWKETWESVTESWRLLLEKVFDIISIK